MAGPASCGLSQNKQYAVTKWGSKLTSDERRERRYQRRKKKREEKRRKFIEQYDDFDKYFDFDHIYNAFDVCKKGITWKYSVKIYDINRLEKSWKTYKSLKTGEYKFKGFIGFPLYERGKLRQINSVHIQDRVVQKCLCDVLIPVLQKSFIYDNHASLKGHGTKKALDRFRCMLDRMQRKYGTEFYALCCDNAKYFDSIMHKFVFENIKNNFTDKKILGLSLKFLREENNIPGRTPGIGLSLGCQPNQIYAVSYQNKIDHIVSQRSDMMFVRYADDSIILCKRKEELKKIKKDIESELDKIGIHFNREKTQIVKASRGIKFLKTMHYITDSGKIVRKPWKKSVVKQRRKLKKMKPMLERGEITFAEVRQSYESWKGYAKQFNTYRTRRNMDKLFNDLFIDDWKESEAV